MDFPASPWNITSMNAGKSLRANKLLRCMVLTAGRVRWEVILDKLRQSPHAVIPDRIRNPGSFMKTSGFLLLQK
jgi:hypothetical protein